MAGTSTVYIEQGDDGDTWNVWVGEEWIGQVERVERRFFSRTPEDELVHTFGRDGSAAFLARRAGWDLGA